MDVQQVSGSSCTCTASDQMRIHTNYKLESKRTNKSFPCSECHCRLSSVKHTRRKHGHYTKNTWYHLHISYLYFLWCVLCMVNVTSSVSVENIIIEDQQTQVGRFFFYNISTNNFPLKDSSQLKVFEAGKNSLPDWLMFDDMLATFSGVPMENDEGNIFIEVNVLDNDHLVIDDIFSIEVRPASAVLFNRKLSKSFLQKLTNSGLSDENMQQLADQDVPEQNALGQSLHFLPSHCSAVSNELIGNLLLRSTTQLANTQWVKLFMLLSDSLGVPINKLYVRNVMYENFAKKALLWGHYIGSDSLADAPGNKTFTLMSFLIGCSKDHVYSDIYRVIIQRANALLESFDEDSLLGVLERWFITLEGDDGTEAQKLHQRQKRQNAVDMLDVQQQDFYVVHTTATTEMVTTSIAVIPTSVIQPVTTVPTVMFSSESILTTTVIPVVTMLPSSPVLSVEPTTIIFPMPTTSSLFSADQTTMDITQSLITPIISSVSLVESISASMFTSIESSLPTFITLPSLTMFFSTSLFVTTSMSEVPSTSFGIVTTSVPLSLTFSSLIAPSSFITDVVITPSVTFTSFEPTVIIITSSLFSSTEISVESTSIVITLLPSTSIRVSSFISVPVSSSVPVVTTSPIITDIETLVSDTLIVTPTSVFSFIVTPSSSEFNLSTQSDIIITSLPVFTDVSIPTTVVSIDDTTIASVVLTSASLAVSSIMATPVISTTPLLETSLVETPTPLSAIVTLTLLPTTTVLTTLFTDMPTFSPVETMFTPTPSVISDDVSLFTTVSITSSSLFVVTTPVSTSTLASPIFNITSVIIVSPSSEVIDTFTIEVPSVTMFISETVIISDTDVDTPSTTAVDISDTSTSFVLPLTTEIPASPSFVSSSSMEPPYFTTMPSLDISSIITSSVPSVTVTDITFTSIVDVSETVFTLPVPPTSVMTAITSEVTSEIISPTRTLSIIDTFSFTASPVASSITSIVTTVDDVSSFSPSTNITSIITPSVTSSIPILPSASTSEVILTTPQPEVSTTIVPVTTFSDVISTSENVTITPLFTNITPTPSISLVVSSSENVTITLPATSIIPTPSVISPSVSSLVTTSEVTTQPDISTSITLPVTLTTDVVNSSEVTLPIPSIMLPSDTPTPSMVSLSTLPVANSSEVVTTALPDVTMISFMSPSISDIINTSTVVTVISPSASIVPTSSLTLTSSATSEVVTPTVITLTDTDTPSVTISSITTSTSSVINVTDVVPPSSIIVVTPTPTNVSSVVTMSPSATTTNTSKLVSPSPSFTETSSITPSVTSIVTSSTTLPIVNTTDVMPSSQVLRPNVTSVIDVTSTTITTDVSSMITSTTTLVDITSSITVTETSSEFIPTTTLVTPTMVTPTMVTPTVSFTSTVTPTPTPTITNQAPQLVNPIRPLTWLEGQSAMYKIPEDTFYDRESGSTSNLSLILQTLPGQLVSNTSWVQLINGVLYGLPLNEQIENSTVTEYVFVLTAQDSQDAEVHDFVVILVEPQDPVIANLITFFVEGNFDLFNQQITEKTRLINGLISFGPTNTTDDVYVRDLLNGSIAVQYGNRTIQNSDCMGFAALMESIFNNETLMYSNDFTNALLPFNVTKVPQADGPCYSTIITPVTTPPDLGAVATEERSSTTFLATIIPGVAVIVILLLVTLFACILYRRTHPSRKHYTFVRRNPIVLEAEEQRRPHRAHRPVVLPDDAIDGEDQCDRPVRMTRQPPRDERQTLIPQHDPPPYRLPLVYHNHAVTDAPSEDRPSTNLPYRFTQHY